MFRRAFVLVLVLVLDVRAAPNEATIAQLYARGLAGDRDAVIECVSDLEKVLAAQPNDQRARVYLGSAYTLRSRDLPFGLSKWSALRRGIALMDEAAAAAPNDARVQLLRAVTNEAFPTLLGRGPRARSALEDLVLKVEANPGILEPADQQLLYLNAGEAAEKGGDAGRALELWRRGAALKADPKLTHEIETALKQE